MLTKLRNTPQVKLAAVTLIGCLILTSCGGGGGDTEGGTRDETGPGTTEPTQVTLSLSESTQDTSQGRAITVDYEGPAFDDDDLSVSVGDTLVGGLVVNDQIHLILPLTESGQTLLTFDFGSFSSDLSLTIDPAPTIADPVVYVSDLIGDLVSSLDQLREGDWQEKVDALLVAQEELANLSEDELRALAIFFVQNLEPILQQLNSPVVAQFDGACGGAISDYLLTFTENNAALAFTAVLVVVGVGGAVSISGGQLTVPAVAAGVVISLGVATLGMNRARNAFREMFQSCITKAFGKISALASRPQGSRSVQVAQELSPLRFDDGVARQLSVKESHRFEHERKSEVLSKTRNLVDTLLTVNNLLRQFVGRNPNLARFFGLNSYIDTLDRYVAEFAAFENPDRVEAADHTNLHLGATSDPNISGFITAATTDWVAIQFAFNNEPSDDCTAFTFNLLNPIDEYNADAIPAQLCVSSDPGPPSPPIAGAICFRSELLSGHIYVRHTPCGDNYHDGEFCTTVQLAASEEVPLCPTWGSSHNICAETEAELLDFYAEAESELGRAWTPATCPE